jgi:hypothetical protein
MINENMTAIADPTLLSHILDTKSDINGAGTVRTSQSVYFAQNRGDYNNL